MSFNPYGCRMAKCCVSVLWKLFVGLLLARMTVEQESMMSEYIFLDSLFTGITRVRDALKVAKTPPLIATLDEW